jgi:hypothetical protein
MLGPLPDLRHTHAAVRQTETFSSRAAAYKPEWNRLRLRSSMPMPGPRRGLGGGWGVSEAVEGFVTSLAGGYA